MTHSFTDKMNEEVLEDKTTQRLHSRLLEISEIGRTKDDGANRMGYADLELKAKDKVVKWMKAIGMSVRVDGAGNVFGRYRGKDDSKVYMAGSHVDTVPNGGHFDGVAGVLTALEIAELWYEEAYIPEYSYEVVIFTDEEGSRFGSSLTGSRSFMRLIEDAELDKFRDPDGLTADQVFENIESTREEFLNGEGPDYPIRVYGEIHIEQGKQLEQKGLSTGIVNGIAGTTRTHVVFTGTAGHAGSTPMTGRSDALVAASEFISTLPGVPKSISDSAVATVGKIEVTPNGVNVIPGKVELIVDARDIDETQQGQLIQAVRKHAENIAEQSSVSVETDMMTRVKPIPAAPEIISKMETSFKRNAHLPVHLPSGAGHDAMNIARAHPMTMLFVRSIGGISHNPAEFSHISDIRDAALILKDFFENYD
ncbi:M20 family metallo-hydrolase [Salinicoccus albus]|uniref:M20 family metallo-hydrolase n=1 Tax=Salinicoccus albus TaxID=418756 RepID=UPI00036D9023|nr:M20 family metallo-hydrolase [Salinicoccus albus]